MTGDLGVFQSIALLQHLKQYGHLSTLGLSHTGGVCGVACALCVCECETGVAQGADCDQELEHVCIFNRGLYHWM